MQIDILWVNFIYSEKATKFCEISTLLFSYVVPVKSKVEISQNFVAFSEYINFTMFVFFGSNGNLELNFGINYIIFSLTKEY